MDIWDHIIMLDHLKKNKNKIFFEKKIMKNQNILENINYSYYK
jgi:hypothetical protein